MIFLSMMILICTLIGTTVYAEDSKVIDGVIFEDESVGDTYSSESGPIQEAETEQKVYQGKEAKGGMPDWLRQVLHGEDHASKLFATDKFQKADTDNALAGQVITLVAKISSWLCGIYAAFIVIRFLVDLLCIFVPALGKLLFNLKLGFLYSETAAGLVNLPMPEGMTASAPKEMPETKSGKIGYWFKDSIITAGIAGAVLVSLATGLLPNLINLLVNFIVNLVTFGYNWVMSL